MMLFITTAVKTSNPKYRTEQRIIIVVVIVVVVVDLIEFNYYYLAFSQKNDSEISSTIAPLGLTIQPPEQVGMPFVFSTAPAEL
jgi:hypothetical protein